MRIVPFVAEDILTIVPREPDKSIFTSIADNLERCRIYATHPSWTGWIDDKVMFCCGIAILWPGMGEGWAYTSDEVKNHPCSFHRAVKRGIEIAAKDHKLKRLQLSIPHSHIVSRIWAHRLGFTREGLMRNYGPDGSDWVRVARYW